MPSAPAPDQSHRKTRLQALLDRAEFGGVKAELARYLGLQSGAYIRQLLEGERPITEKFIDRVERAHGGKYRGWFAAAGAEDFISQALAALQVIESDQALRNRALGYLQGLAEQAAQSSGGASTDQAERSPFPKRAA